MLMAFCGCTGVERVVFQSTKCTPPTPSQHAPSIRACAPRAASQHSLFTASLCASLTGGVVGSLAVSHWRRVSPSNVLHNRVLKPDKHTATS
ncbi:hypothetical protein Zmor_007545 [Zophobas morio]|uniref:Uncharacterized protein n=1 Tax=Zophobas morio TaxID=2755281 RepID=A0AA38IXI4_9CUCU|nr:hypothetical protein Zmor_007545 [Zophobas morio]